MERKHPSLTDQVLNICTIPTRLTDDEESDRTPLLRKAKRGSRSRRRKFAILRRFAESIAIVILALVLTALVVLFCMFFTGTYIFSRYAVPISLSVQLNIPNTKC
jgi:hypothetical protein